MKKMWILLALLLLFICGIMVSSQAFEDLSVLVKETQVRSQPSYLGKVLAVLHYGDRVKAGEKEKGFYKIQLPDKSGEGWVHSSALIKKQIVMNAGDSEVKKYASSDDVVLAGKGFNKEVEDSYKKEKNLDFTPVDEMEKIVVNQSEIVEFLNKGLLTGLEGGE
ncbi:MAG: SH3 domain-containing protein [Spirochaetales bacterium]|nr:SH3 domain-containing protein [Spirochaetales bacterium]